MLKLGITGGIGSGKSIVCRIFKNLGIPVFTADLEARIIINSDEKIAELLIKKFGKDIYIYEGLVDGPKLAKQMFSSEESLQYVNSIVHPAVMEIYSEWASAQTAKYNIIETAILFESGVNSYVDKVISVFSPLQIRINRTMKRDQISEDEVTARINSQLDEDEKIKKSDFIIYNNEEQLVIPQVLELHKILTNFICTD